MKVTIRRKIDGTRVQEFANVKSIAWLKDNRIKIKGGKSFEWPLLDSEYIQTE